MSDWMFLTPDDWEEDLKVLKEKTDKKILITYLIESCGYWPLLGDSHDNMLELIHTYSHPDNQIWYVNGDYNAQRNYDDWCELVKPKMRINMYPLVPAYNREVFLTRWWEFRKLYNEEVDAPKKYRIICMVNQPKISRILTLRELAGYPGFIYSFNGTDIEDVNERGISSDKTFERFANKLRKTNNLSWGKDGNSINSIPVDNFCEFDISYDVFDISNRINFNTPYVEGFENDTDAFHDFLPVQEWLESEIDLVCESHTIKRFHFSEKTCRPIGFVKPFLVIGCVGWHRIFKQLGFELYDELFDYSFDDIEPFRERHKEIINQVKSILDMDKQLLNDKIQAIQDKMQYNKKRFFEYREYMDITKIAKQIDDSR